MAYRYYIAFNVKPYVRPQPGKRYPERFVWPLLFDTAEEAWAHLERVNPFQNTGHNSGRSGPCLIPGKRRIVSCSVEATRPAGRR